MTEERRIEIDGHGLFSRTEGSGDRNFLCLHGLVDSLEIWDRMAPALSGRGRLIRIDQRAHGRSDAPPGPYSREALADDVIGVLDALEIERAILVGHSMGGIVAMSAALAHPRRVAGLVLIGTASRCNERTSRWYERIARAGERHGTDGLARAIYGEDTQRAVAGDAQGIAHVTRMLESLYSDPLTPALAALECPTLLLVGEKDPMGPRATESIREAIPVGRATLKVVSSCGHWVHVDAPEVIVEALDRWLESAGTRL